MGLLCGLSVKIMKNYLIIMMVLVFLGCQKKTGETEAEVVQDTSNLSKLERIDLSDLEGNPISLADYRGKRIFLNLWATWCKPCLAEMPDLSKANDILSKEGYVFLAASDENLKKINDFVRKHDYSFQFVKMNNSVYDLDVSALPTTFIINAEGELVYDEVGARNWASESELEKLRKF